MSAGGESVPSATALRRALARLDRRSLAAFVAACWRARGFETTREAAVVRADRDGERRTVLVVEGATGRPTLPWRTPAVPREESVDVVVAADADRAEAVAANHDATAVGPVDLRNRLLYGMDRDVADRLCRQHLGRPLARVGVEGPVERRLPRGVSPRTAGAACLLVLAVAVTVALPLVAGTPTGLETRGAATGHGASGGGGTFVDGVGGVSEYPAARVDGHALAQVHRRALAGRPRRATGRVDETVDGPDPDPTIEQVAWRARVATPGRYRYRLVGAREVENGLLRSVTERTFADGERRYDRRGDAGSGSAVRVRLLRDATGPAPDAVLTAGVVRRYLDGARVVGTDRRNGTTVVHLRRERAPAALRSVTNFTAEATVGVDGVVRELSVRYDVETADGPAPVAVRFAYDLGPTEVDRPAWVTTAVDAST